MTSRARINELLTLCLRARRDPKAREAFEVQAVSDQVDWDFLAKRAEIERLGSLLHSVFPEASFIPPAVTQGWHRAHRAAALFYVVWSSALSRISVAMAERKIPFIVLKGAVLSETIYETPTLRPLVDVDILVRPDCVAATLEVLQANDYLPPRSAESEGYTLHFENELPVSPRNPIGVVIDVHWSLFDSPYYQRALSHDWFWETSEPFPRYGSARMLGTEAQLLHLSAHLMVHHHGRGLLWLYDIVELLGRRHTVIDWDRSFQQAQRSELVLSLQRTLARATDEMGAKLEPSRRAQLSRLVPSTQELRVFAHPTIGKDTAEHFWNDVIVLPNWRTRAAYIGVRLVPAPAFMRERYRIRGTAWLALYYPLRWLTAAWQLGQVLISRFARRGQRDTRDAISRR